MRSMVASGVGPRALSSSQMKRAQGSKRAGSGGEDGWGTGLDAGSRLGKGWAAITGLGSESGTGTGSGSGSGSGANSGTAAVTESGTGTGSAAESGTAAV